MSATSLSVLDNLHVSTLINWNDVSRVRKISKGCYFMQDIEQLNVGIPMASKPIHDTIYRETYEGDDEIAATVASTAIVGGNLVVNLQPIGGNQVDFFREDNVVFGNNTEIQGLVVSQTAGQIVVKPMPGTSITVAQLLASIVAGGQVQAMGVAGPWKNSGRPTGINYFPEIQANYLNLLREGADWNRVDMQNAKISYQDGFWVSSNISRTLDRMLKDIERTWMWGIPAYDQSQSFSRNGGVDWAIRNRGGVVSTFAALPSQGQFQSWLKEVMYRRPGSIKLKKLYLGNMLYEHINNNFTTGYILQLEPKGMLSGDINYNANRYKVGGFEVDLVTNLALLQEMDYNNALTQGIGMTGMKKEWSAYLIDQEPVGVVGGGTVPAIEKIHHSDSPFYIGRSTGIGDCPVGMPTAEGQLGSPDLYKVSTSAVDRSELNIMYHGGINMVTGNYSGFFGASI